MLSVRVHLHRVCITRFVQMAEPVDDCGAFAALLRTSQHFYPTAARSLFFEDALSHWFGTVVYDQAFNLERRQAIEQRADFVLVVVVGNKNRRMKKRFTGRAFRFQLFMEEALEIARDLTSPERQVLAAI